VIEADLVVTAIGDVPKTEWLSGPGLETAAGGVMIDDRCVAVSP
jgi:NADPH-dependent 2,4-dienoyl-CoA reductase/sulfur reductase-like enzyme